MYIYIYIYTCIYNTHSITRDILFLLMLPKKGLRPKPGDFGLRGCSLRSCAQRWRRASPRPGDSPGSVEGKKPWKKNVAISWGFNGTQWDLGICMDLFGGFDGIIWLNLVGFNGIQCDSPSFQRRHSEVIFIHQIYIYIYIFVLYIYMILYACPFCTET